MVITSLFSSFFCNCPSQDEVRMFIKTFGLLLVLLSSYNRLAALGLVLALVAASYPRDEGQNRTKKVESSKNWVNDMVQMSMHFQVNLSVQENTQLALDELRRFECFNPKCLTTRDIYRHCLQPEVNVWGIVSQLKDPHHFANFINTSEEHITQAEITEHQEWTAGGADKSGGISEIVKTMFWSKDTKECHGHRFNCILCTDKIIGHRFNCNQCFFDP